VPKIPKYNSSTRQIMRYCLEEDLYKVISAADVKRLIQNEINVSLTNVDSNYSTVTNFDSEGKGHDPSVLGNLDLEAIRDTSD
jgi:hypothetical protein